MKKMKISNDGLTNTFFPSVVRLLVKSTTDKREFPYTGQGYVKSQVMIFEKKKY